MDTVKFGVVGLGMGYVRAKLIKDTPGAQLTAVCDLNENRACKVASELGCRAFTSYDAMLADGGIDVAYIVTPSGAHLEMAAQAAAAGKHIVTTKPMEVTVDRSRQMIDVCREHKVQFIVDFQMRYEAPLQQWKAAIDAGELGKVVFGEARCKWWRSQAYYDAGGWRGTWKMDGGGSVANQGIHLVDLLIWLLGEPTILAVRAGVFNHTIETEDLTIALLETPNGSPSTILTTTNYHLNDEYGVSVTGTLGHPGQRLQHLRRTAGAVRTGRTQGIPHPPARLARKRGGGHGPRPHPRRRAPCAGRRRPPLDPVHGGDVPESRDTVKAAQWSESRKVGKSESLTGTISIHSGFSYPNYLCDL
ncbi:MAG: Gfo/Idh/MocA family oxidoreductase [Planctomycetota bacterium]